MVRNVLNIKVLREIKHNFKTYLSVILIATLAVTLFTGILANYRNFNDRLNHIYEEANMCDGIVMLDHYDEQVEAFIEQKAVTYEKRIYLPAKYQSSPLYIATFSNDKQLNRPFTSTVEQVDDSMVFVDKNFLSKNHLDIGSILTADFLFNNQKLSISMEISGTMTHPESLENSTYNPAFVYVGEQALIEAMSKALLMPQEQVSILLKPFYNQFLIRGGDVEGWQDELSQFECFIYALNRSNLPSNKTVEADVTQAKKLIYIFPVIFYLVAVLIILTSISQLIQRENKNIGILKALGFQKSEILVHYMKIFLVLGVIGSIFGMLLGPLIVPAVMSKKYQILYQLPNLSLPFFRWEYLISVGILMVIIAVVSVGACMGAMNKVPAASLRGDNAVMMKLSFFNRFSFVKKLPLAILMAFRNMKRKLSRTFMVILGVMGCSALLVCGFGIEDTIEYGFNLELEEYIPYDLSVVYDEEGSRREALSLIEGIDQIDEYSKYSVHLKKQELISSYLYLLPEQTEVFQVSCEKEDCILSSKVAEEIGAEIGDTISFVYQNVSYEIQVTKIVDFCLSQGMFVCSDRVSFSSNPTGAWISVADQGDSAKIAEELSSVQGILSAITIEDTRSRAENTISSIKVMTWTIKIFAILLAVVVLYNLALLNFKERIKDIATLKVLGFSRFEVAASFIIEIILLTFLSSLIGLVLGYPLLVAVLSINQNPLLSYIYHISISSYLWTILITCGSSFLINLIFAYLTNRVQMVESLKSVE